MEKIPARTKKRRRTKNPSWISVLPPCCLSVPSRPGTARGGNCIKVDVGYARDAPSVRGIINSQRRAVTKVRACSLVSRSVSGQANSSSPSSFRHLHHFTPFFSLTRKSLNRSERNNSCSQPSSVSITAHLFLFYLRQRIYTYIYEYSF